MSEASEKTVPGDEFASIFLAPISDLLSDPEVSEVMVNAHDQIWVEKKGKLVRMDDRSFTEDSLYSAINSLAQYVGRPLMENVFSVDARMPDGSRVCIVLPPVSGSDPAFSIRVFKKALTDISFLIEKGSIAPEMAQLIDVCIQTHKNIIVAGGTGSGKTTLLNLIGGYIPNNDRILTIEDTKELQLVQEHILSLEAKPPDKHGQGMFTIRDCLKSSLRLRPDRIVVGEIRGGEGFDLVQAMNTGHGGCMGTVHANSPLDTLRRMESLCLMADVGLPLMALRAMIASSMEILVYAARLPDGSRKVTQVSEVGSLDENGEYQVHDIARYVSDGKNPDGSIIGHFEFTGYLPELYNKFTTYGVNLGRDFFQARICGDKEFDSTTQVTSVTDPQPAPETEASAPEPQETQQPDAKASTPVPQETQQPEAEASAPEPQETQKPEAKASTPVPQETQKPEAKASTPVPQETQQPKATQPEAKDTQATQIEESQEASTEVLQPPSVETFEPEPMASPELQDQVAPDNYRDEAEATPTAASAPQPAPTQPEEEFTSPGIDFISDEDVDDESETNQEMHASKSANGASPSNEQEPKQQVEPEAGASEEAPEEPILDFQAEEEESVPAEEAAANEASQQGFPPAGGNTFFFEDDEVSDEEEEQAQAPQTTGARSAQQTSNTEVATGNQQGGSSNFADRLRQVEGQESSNGSSDDQGAAIVDIIKRLRASRDQES